MQPRIKIEIPSNKRNKGLLLIERLLPVLGGILLAIYAFARIDSWISSDAALREFDQAYAEKEPEAAAVTLREFDEEYAEKPPETPAVATQPQGDDDIDCGLWSDNRIRALEKNQSPKEGCSGGGRDDLGKKPSPESC